MAKKAAKRKPKKAVVKAAPKPKPKRKPKKGKTMSKDKDKDDITRAVAKPTADTPAPTPVTTEVVPPVDLLTEQEEDVYTGGDGVGPAAASVESVPVETIESQGIGPRDPYPSAETPPAGTLSIAKEAKKGK